MDEEDTRCRSRIWLAGEMRRILALGFAGGSSFGDLEDDDCRRLEDGFLGRVPLMAASKRSRSLRLRNICVGAPIVVIPRCGRGGKAILPSVLDFDSAETPGDRRNVLGRMMMIRVLNME